MLATVVRRQLRPAYLLRGMSSQSTGLHLRSQLFVGGEWRDASDGGTFTVFNPSTGRPLMQCSSATREDVNDAVVAARACVEGDEWGSATTGEHRAACLRRFAAILQRRKDEMGRVESTDCGKPLRESAADMSDCIEVCEMYARFAVDLDQKQHENVPLPVKDFTTQLLYEPKGVIACITPWNYPLLMAMQKVSAAWAAGCAVVLKPSELAPATCLLLGEIAQEAGIPAGALNIVPGLGNVTGQALAEHEDVDFVSFTGSVRTGQHIMRAAATTGPRGVSLELGGKSSMIVFDDVDVEATVDWIMVGCFWGAGQVCSATSRLLLHRNIKDAIMQRLMERVAQLKVADPLSPVDGPIMGPVVSAGQRDRIAEYLRVAREEGLELVHGGDVVTSLGDGYFVQPTIFANVPTTSRLWNEEIFGPVLCVREFETEEEAIKIANDTEYGLAGAVMSSDKARLDRVSRKITAGVVWKNCSQPAFVHAPWGGCKKSGFGRELGKWGLEEFLNIKQVTECDSAHSYRAYT